MSHGDLHNDQPLLSYKFHIETNDCQFQYETGRSSDVGSQCQFQHEMDRPVDVGSHSSFNMKWIDQ